jgi:hypothetical protein
MIIDTYSKNNAAPCIELKYQSINAKCRLQIVNIITDYFEYNHAEPYAEEHFWPFVQKMLKDEHGEEALYREHVHNAFGGYIVASAEVTGYFKSVDEIEKLLDIIQLIFTLLVGIESSLSRDGHTIHYKAEIAIEHLNKRFSEHCIGYKFADDQIIRIDNELLYNNITKSVLTFLTDPEYKNIDEEYMQAHKHFRSGNYKDCIVNCAKAFESTMKIICVQKDFSFQQNDTSSKLLNVLDQNNYFPNYLQSGLSGLRAVLEAIATVRNKTSAHGAGSATVEVDERLAGYALNITGSNIKFLLSFLM